MSRFLDRVKVVLAAATLPAAAMVAAAGCAPAPSEPPHTPDVVDVPSEGDATSGLAPVDDGEEGATEPGPSESEGSAQVTESGLGIEDVKVGSGPAVEEGQRVTVHYVGRLESGKVFDDSRKRGEPYAFKVGDGKVIAGWDEGVIGMQVGGLRRLTVPAKLAYGERGQMPTIPPNALLEFEIELMALEE